MIQLYSVDDPNSIGIETESGRILISVEGNKICVRLDIAKGGEAIVSYAKLPPSKKEKEKKPKSKKMQSSPDDILADQLDRMIGNGLFSPTERNVMRCLQRRFDRYCSAKQLIGAGQNISGTGGLSKVMKNLRAKLETKPWNINGTTSTGFRLYLSDNYHPD